MGLVGRGRVPNYVCLALFAPSTRQVVEVYSRPHNSEMQDDVELQMQTFDEHEQIMNYM